MFVSQQKVEKLGIYQTAFTLDMKKLDKKKCFNQELFYKTEQCLHQQTWHVLKHIKYSLFCLINSMQLFFFENCFIIKFPLHQLLKDKSKLKTSRNQIYCILEINKSLEGDDTLMDKKNSQECKIRFLCFNSQMLKPFFDILKQ